MVIISVFQTDDRGSIPLTRSKEKTAHLGGFKFTLDCDWRSCEALQLP